MNTRPRAVRLTDAQTGTDRNWPDMISLPHGSGWDGIVVGKLVDECADCTRLNAARRRAWRPPNIDWAREKWAREEFHRHWERAHRV